jgi:hypothetical protein
MGSIIHTKGITSKNGLISSEIGRGGQDFFYTLYFNDMAFVWQNAMPLNHRQDIIESITEGVEKISESA